MNIFRLSNESYSNLCDDFVSFFNDMEEFMAYSSKKYRKSEEQLLKFYMDSVELKKRSDILVSNGTTKSAMKFARYILKSNSETRYLKITGVDKEIVPQCVELLTTKSPIVQLDLSDIVDEGSNLFLNTMPWERFTLKLMKIYDCTIDGNWLQRLFTCLKENPYLERLYIENCGLNNSHADNIASLLESNNSVIALSLFDGDLSDSISKIFKAVKRNRKLKRLRFDETTLGKHGVEQFIDFFESDSRIEHFGFTCINWNDEIVKRFAKVLENKKSFYSIDLYGGKFTRTGFAHIVDVVNANPCICEIDITSIKVIGQQPFNDQIKKLLTNNNGLKIFTFNGCGPDYRQTIVNSLKSNYLITDINSHPGYRKVDSLAKDPQITAYINRNVRYQANLAQDLIYDARALLLLQLPFEIKEHVLKYLCTAAMVSHYQHKYLVHALLDRGSLGKLAPPIETESDTNSISDMMGRLRLSTTEFNQQALIDRCIAYYHETNVE
ncbi:hypothetical protein HDV06_002108 [Boothiomyces sp. JEL0866]|nr:hypothetical protein HDV06_002108 [Boothiomyces sp. JEL0866]